MHSSGFSTFAAMILFLFLSISWLNYRTLKRLAGASRHLRAAQWLYCGASLGAALLIALFRVLHPPTASWSYIALQYLTYAAIAWLVTQLLIFIAQPLLFAVSRWGIRHGSPSSPSRRAFLRGAMASVPLLAAGTSVRGVYASLAELEVNRLALSYHDLPDELNGFTLVQVSDVHIGPYFSPERLDTLLSAVRDAKPDLLVITGDLIDDIDRLKQTVDKLNALAPQIPCGIYFCWGNHEYFRNFPLIRETLYASAVHVLTNRNETIFRGSQPLPLFIAGVDYPWTDSPAERASMRSRFTAAALSGIPGGAFRILLAHHPDFLDDGFAADVPLTLAGHTHGGQVYIAGLPVLPFSFSYLRGLYQKGDNRGYVNVGAGQWFPFRLGCPPEIAVFTLQKR